MTVHFADTESFSKHFTFSVVDYSVFSIMLAISVGIGVYFGFFSGKNNTTDEYLLGGKRMTTWPIAISLIASQLSGISVIALPAEMYSFGVTYAFIVSSMFLVVPILCYVIVPVFYDNSISNCYEYLELRFNKETRRIVTLAYILTVFLYLPVYIFVPSLAFSQVTGNNIHVINAIVCSVCVFYTMLEQFTDMNDLLEIKMEPIGAEGPQTSVSPPNISQDQTQIRETATSMRTPSCGQMFRIGNDKKVNIMPKANESKPATSVERMVISLIDIVCKMQTKQDYIIKLLEEITATSNHSPLNIKSPAPDQEPFQPIETIEELTNLDSNLARKEYFDDLGGIKAVVWTDVVQGGIMVASIIIVGVIGIMRVGGFIPVIENAFNGGRLHVYLDLDPRTRATVWNCFFGGLCLWTGNIGLNQTCVQRVVALPSINRAKKSLVIAGIGFFVIMLFNCFTGIIMYSFYHGCDPLKLKIVEKSDKMLPFFVQDIAGHLSGMPGVFISCVFSAALSTISANLNSLSGIFYFDYVKPFIKHTERKANFVMKAFVLFSGVYCILGGFIVEKSKSILQTVLTIGGMTQGSIVGVFLLGLLVPKANGKAALIGLVSSMIVVLCIIVGAQRKIKAGELFYSPLPTRVDGCDRFNYTLYSSIFKETITKTSSIQKADGFSIFDISFHWYKFSGAVVVWIIAIPLSYLIPENKEVNFNLLSPFIRDLKKLDLEHVDRRELDELNREIE